MAAFDRIRVKETLIWPSGKIFTEGDVYWGTWTYSNKMYATKDNSSGELPLCTIVRSDGSWLVYKENFELIEKHNK